MKDIMNNKQKLTAIDLFAGIGGFHLALNRLNIEVVFASEIDKSARETYIKNHNIELNKFNDDIRRLNPHDIPDHDILCAGFPCQPFSQAGHKRGFEDGSNSERGNLFFNIIDILRDKRPKAFILENVRHLLKHDNEKTFARIKKELHELDYSVSYKIIKASEFGRPQHRARIFIVGFDKYQVLTDEEFEFPNPIPLKMNMSDVWQGNCDREIGFTLRVGGRGSHIDDRRNWDSYRVDGEVKRLTPIQGKIMMGFPEEFVLPSSITQAMKQLGNSVCVDVVEHVAKSVSSYLNRNTGKNMVTNTFNKGEWSEIYTFFKLIFDNKLYFANALGQKITDYVTVFEISHNNDEIAYQILKGNILFKDVSGKTVSKHSISSLISLSDIQSLLDEIKDGKGRSFALAQSQVLLNRFMITSFKGNSSSKGDICTSFDNNGTQYLKEPLGIKSYIGAKPTLLNASSATNFVYEVNGLTVNIDTINGIKTRAKIKDRLTEIIKHGGSFTFIGCEQAIHESNLRLVDSQMPEIISDMLLDYYSGKGSKVDALITDTQKIIRFKEYLKSIMLGMFSSKPWDGQYTSNGSILAGNDGELSLFHVTKDHLLKDYLFMNTKLDTPSSTRHRFGTLYKEPNGKIYLKLNLQIRML